MPARKVKKVAGPTLESLEAQRKKTAKLRKQSIPDTPAPVRRTSRKKSVAVGKKKPQKRSRTKRAAKVAMPGGASDSIPTFDAATDTLVAAFPTLEVRTQPPKDPRCVAYAFAAAMDLCTIVSSGTDPSTHPRYSVDDTFARMKKDPDIMRGVKAVQDGVTNEDCWPHGALAGCPDIATRRFRATVNQPTGTKPRDMIPVMCDALDAGIPLVTAIPLFQNFRAFKGAGIYKAKGKVVGAHALVIIGYEESLGDTSGCWVALNSWGADWGDGGHVRIQWLDVDLRPEGSVFLVANVA